MARDTGLVLSYLLAFVFALCGLAMLIMGIINAASNDPRQRRGPGVYVTFPLGVVSCILSGLAIFLTRRM